MSTRAADAEPKPLYIRAATGARMLDVSVATWWRWVAAGRLPQPRKLGPGVTVWRLDEVERTIEAVER